MLPVYQNAHPKYDRFLPFLARGIGESDCIIDVGANVGDSLASMAEQNIKPTYICIEADDAFFQMLQKNVETIKRALPGAKIETIKALVGKSIANASLEGKGGSKHAVVSDNGKEKAAQLDELLRFNGPIRILKSDVDGFDYDVLNSSMITIERYKPIIFFEMQCDYPFQKIEYKRTLQALKDKGYCNWILFDNFGQVMISTHDLSVIFQLMDYAWAQSSRTIYYFDVLVSKIDDVSLIDKAIDDYRSFGPHLHVQAQ